MLPDIVVIIIIIVHTYSAIDILLIDMNNDVKVELTTPPRPEIKRTHREGVRMNTTALRREMHIKKRLQNNKHK